MNWNCNECDLPFSCSSLLSLVPAAVFRMPRALIRCTKCELAVPYTEKMAELQRAELSHHSKRKLLESFLQFKRNILLIASPRLEGLMKATVFALFWFSCVLLLSWIFYVTNSCHFHTEICYLFSIFEHSLNTDCARQNSS